MRFLSLPYFFIFILSCIIVGEPYTKVVVLVNENDVQIAKHDQLLQQHAKEIEEIKDVTYGLPQTLEKITFVVTELSSNMKEMGNDMKEFLRVSDKKYATKEMSEMCREDVKEEIREIKDKQKKIEWGLIVSGGYIVWEFFKTYIMKVGG